MGAQLFDGLERGAFERFSGEDRESYLDLIQPGGVGRCRSRTRLHGRSPASPRHPRYQDNARLDARAVLGFRRARQALEFDALFARQYNRGRLFCSGVPVPWRLRPPEIASPTRPFLAVALEIACASIDQSPPHGGGPRIGPARTRFREAMSPINARSRGF